MAADKQEEELGLTNGFSQKLPRRRKRRTLAGRNGRRGCKPILGAGGGLGLRSDHRLHLKRREEK